MREVGWGPVPSRTDNARKAGCKACCCAVLNRRSSPLVLARSWLDLSPDAKHLLMGMLAYDPARRLTIHQARMAGNISHGSKSGLSAVCCCFCPRAVSSQSAACCHRSAASQLRYRLHSCTSWVNSLSRPTRPLQVLAHEWVVSRGGILPRPLGADVVLGARTVASIRRLRNLCGGVVAFNRAAAAATSGGASKQGKRVGQQALADSAKDTYLRRLRQSQRWVGRGSSGGREEVQRRFSLPAVHLLRRPC